MQKLKDKHLEELSEYIEKHAVEINKMEEKRI